MPEARAPRRRLRLALAGVAAALLVALAGLVLAVYLVLQPDRFTAMLQEQARGAGLELSLASPARPTLFPHPALELRGLTLTAQGASMPILLAARGRLALPWRTLLGGPTVISRLEIDAPRVDLDALQAWLAALPPGPSTGLEIPRIDTGVRITRGTLVSSNKLLLRNFSLDAGTLRSGQPFPLGVSAQTAAGTRVQMDLLATPRIAHDTLQLDDVHLDLTLDDGVALALRGGARWHGAADAWADLSGTFDRGGDRHYQVALALRPAGQDDPLLLRLKLQGPGDHVEVALPPLALARWWGQLGRAEGPQLAVPPGRGRISAERLDVAGLHFEGLEVQAGIPAPAASAAAPAKAASTR